MAVSSWFGVVYPLGGSVKYRIEVTENSQNTTENYTNITVRVQVSSSIKIPLGTGVINCTIDGTHYENIIMSSQIVTSSGLVAFEKTLNIYHDANGSKSIRISAEFASSSIVSDDQGFTVTLTTIASKSEITSISGGTIGSTMTVNIDRKFSSYTTSVWIWLGDSGWVNTVWKSTATSISFTIPMNLCNYIPSATSGSGTVKIRTYSGDTEIGDCDWGHTFYVPDSVKPNISQVLLDTTTQVNNQWMWIQHKSQLRVRTTASGSYESWISSIRIDYDSSQYWGSDVYTNTQTISGSRGIWVHVWDSRGRYAGWSGTVYVQPYQNPWGSISAYRCDSNGNRDDSTGTYVKVIYSGYRSALNEANTFRIRIDRRTQGGSWGSLKVDRTTHASNESAIIDGFSIEKAYEIRMRISDWYTTTTYIIPISTAFVLVDFRRGGRGIAFGKVSQDDTMEVNMELDLYAGRDNNQNYGADLNFCKVSNESQKIGWCGGTPSSDTLLQLFKHTSGDSAGAGTLMKVDKWNVCYYDFGTNYFKNDIKFYGGHHGEGTLRHDGSGNYLFFHSPSGGGGSQNIGAYSANASHLIWEYLNTSSQLVLKSGYGTSSDERVKYDFDEFTNWEDYYNFYMSLKPKTFKYNYDQREEKHIGLIAQDVADSIVDNNLNNEKLCLVKCHENDDMEDGREYTLAYQELISLNIKMIQKHEKEVQKLNNVITKQQYTIDQLKEMVNQLINQGGV